MTHDLLELADYVDEAGIQTLALEQFARDYRKLMDISSPSCCRVGALDPLSLRKCGLFNDAIITSALESLCM